MEAQVAQPPRDRGLLLALHEPRSSLHETLDRLPAAAYSCDTVLRAVETSARLTAHCDGACRGSRFVLRIPLLG